MAGPGLASPGSLPKKGGEARNLLLLLHGFGGRRDAFVELGRGLQLPKTTVLALNGPDSLPEELLDDPPGFSWFSMLDENWDFIQPARGERRRSASLQRSRRLLADLLEELQRKGWCSEEIFLLGYGQGGTVALDLLFPAQAAGRQPGREDDGSWAGKLGGLLCIASEVLPERQMQLEELYRAAAAGPAEKPTSGLDGTGVLLIHGLRDDLVALSSAEASVRLLQRALAQGKGSARLKSFKDRGGEMLRGGHAEEMRVVMEFFADRLHGVGRRGSEEAMRRLGAEPVVDAERMPSGTTVEEVVEAGDQDVPSGGVRGADAWLEEMD